MTLWEFVIYLKVNISILDLADWSKIGWDIPTEWAYSISTVEVGLRYVNSCLKMAGTSSSKCSLMFCNPKRSLMFWRAWIHNRFIMKKTMYWILVALLFCMLLIDIFVKGGSVFVPIQYACLYYLVALSKTIKVKNGDELNEQGSVMSTTILEFSNKSNMCVTNKND